jgi:hypothetical protein
VPLPRWPPRRFEGDVRGSRLQALGVAALGAVLIVGVSRATTQASQRADAAKPQFVDFEFAETPGTVCPGSSECWNTAVEPQIRADGDGAFYVSSENGFAEGTIAAKSIDRGRHYASLPSPNAVSETEELGFAPGGGDTDVAIAPEKNANGFYNVYVASLTLAEIDVSTSTDGGASWRLNPTAARVPGDDREWIAADGASKVCISYHDLVTFNVNVDCSDDAGATFTQHASAIDAKHAFLLQNNQIGNLAIDPDRHTIYQALTGIATPAEAGCGAVNTCKYHAVWIAVSTDGGLSFTDYPVHVGASAQVGFNHLFPNVAVDGAGNVYALWSDDHDVYYSFSTDSGITWSKPEQVNRGPVRTAIMPWAAAGDDGKLDVVYYGTSYADRTTPPDSYPRSAAWYVYFGQNLKATEKGGHFSQEQVSPVVHYGGVCESGISCSGNRDLFDDFGVAASPITGLASIAYTDDQYDDGVEGPPSPQCTPERTNTLRCDHTNIATQTAGPGIFGADDKGKDKKDKDKKDKDKKP